MCGVYFLFMTSLRRYAKDKATGDMSESFIGAINNINVEISKKLNFIECDEEEDVDLRTQLILIVYNLRVFD